MNKSSLIILLLASLLVACGGSSVTEVGNQQPNAVEPAGGDSDMASEPDMDAEPVPTPTSAEPTPSFEARTYRDEENGFAFEFPVKWELANQGEEFSRGTVVQLYQGEEPALTVSVLSWDPSGQLAAYSEMRETAWLNSEFEILAEEQLTLSDGTSALRYVVESPAGDRSLFLMLELDQRYLVLSGTGDLEALRQVTASLRLLENES